MQNLLTRYNTTALSNVEYDLRENAGFTINNGIKDAISELQLADVFFMESLEKLSNVAKIFAESEVTLEAQEQLVTKSREKVIDIIKNFFSFFFGKIMAVVKILYESVKKIFKDISQLNKRSKSKINNVKKAVSSPSEKPLAIQSTEPPKAIPAFVSDTTANDDNTSPNVTEEPTITWYKGKFNIKAIESLDFFVKNLRWLMYEGLFLNLDNDPNRVVNDWYLKPGGEEVLFQQIGLREFNQKLAALLDSMTTMKLSDSLDFKDARSVETLSKALESAYNDIILALNKAGSYKDTMFEKVKSHINSKNYNLSNNDIAVIKQTLTLAATETLTQLNNTGILFVNLLSIFKANATKFYDYTQNNQVNEFFIDENCKYDIYTIMTKNTIDNNGNVIVY